jgi:Leucine-rich repeat (LRR) protein
MCGRTMMIRGLQALDLSKNKLEELPHGVGAHKALRNLDLKENTYRPLPHTRFSVSEERESARARARERESEKRDWVEGVGASERASEREREREKERVSASLHQEIECSMHLSPYGAACANVGMDGG